MLIELSAKEVNELKTILKLVPKPYASSAERIEKKLFNPDTDRVMVGTSVTLYHDQIKRLRKSGNLSQSIRTIIDSYLGDEHGERNTQSGSSTTE